VNAEVDVAIVGYGPVGQALAAMLRRAGHNVAAFERFNEIYRLPRAVHIDHEIMRLLQAVGLGERLAEEMVPLREDRWFGALFRKAKIRRTSAHEGGLSTWGVGLVRGLDSSRRWQWPEMAGSENATYFGA
jgi:2-polyprenyl-6-methoxyphenol hydroxylase-like FAD-dependent oxidoreductase